MRGGGSPSCGDRVSKTGERKGELLREREQRWRLEGILEPLGQVAISEQVQAEKGGEGGQGPACAGAIVEQLEYQDGQQ